MMTPQEQLAEMAKFKDWKDIPLSLIGDFHGEYCPGCIELTKKNEEARDAKKAQNT